MSGKNEDKRKFPDDFLRVNIKTLKLCGLWNCFGIERRGKHLYTVFSGIGSFIILHHNLTQIAYAIYNRHDFVKVISVAGLIVTYGTLFLKRILFLLLNKRIYRLVYKLRDGELSSSDNWTEEEADMAKNYDQRARMMSWSYYWLGIVCLFFFCLTGMLTGVIEEEEFMNKTTTSIRNLPYNEAVFEFDIQKGQYYAIALLLQGLVVFFGPTSNIGQDTMFVALVIHASGQIKILKLALRKMKERAIRMKDTFKSEKSSQFNIHNTDIFNKDETDSINEDLNLIEAFKNEFNEDIHLKIYEDQSYLTRLLQVKLAMCLNDCIRHHQEIAKFTKELQDIFSPISLIQFLSSSVALCVITFTIAVSDASQIVTYIVFLAISIMQLLFFCWFGSELTYQFETLGEAIYDSPWYESSLDFQKNIHTMLIRSTKSFILTGGNIYLMNLNTFLTMMKASFSYYTMLKEMDVS
ncbi:Odorant receptor 73 [Blattella germanica]|nr:Odorant receptor 73 [Blattella germanica]